MDNAIIADAFEAETKKQLAVISLEDQAEILLEKSPYQLIKQLCVRSITRLKN